MVLPSQQTGPFAVSVKTLHSAMCSKPTKIMTSRLKSGSLPAVSLGIIIVILILYVVAGRKVLHKPKALEKQSSDLFQCTLVIHTVNQEAKPLDRVQVAIEGDSVMYYTDRDGQFAKKIKGVLPGDTIRIRVAKWGHETLSATPPHIVIDKRQHEYYQQFEMAEIQKQAPLYSVEFSFQDETGALVQDVNVHRNNAYVGKSSRNGKFVDIVKASNQSYVYQFTTKESYDNAIFTLKPHDVDRGSIKRLIELKRLLFGVRCIDTTQIYEGNMANVSINEINGEIIGTTDRKGEFIGIPLISSPALVKLRFEKRDTFPSQIHELLAEKDKVSQVMLYPRVGRLVITVITTDSSVVPDAIVTITGNGFHESQISDRSGKVCFNSVRIIPGNRFMVRVRSEELATWIDQWDTERKFVSLVSQSKK